MHIIDLSIVIAYLGICILSGLYKSKQIHTLKDYTLGSGRFSDVILISTIFMTFIGAEEVMGVAGKVYMLGMFFAVAKLVSPLFWFIASQIYARNIDQFYGCMSISGIMHRLYGTPGMWVTNIASILLSIGMISIQSLALGYIFQYFFHIPKIYGMCFGMAITTIYSALGGIRAVALTDVFQFSVVIIAIPILCSFAYRDVGGYQGMIYALPQEMMVLDINKNNILLFCSLIFYGLLPVNGGPFLQRFLIASHNTQITRIMKVIPLIHLFCIIIICLLGFIIKIKAPDIDHNDALYYFIDHYAPIGVLGIVLAGLLATIMSTADSWLNTTGILFAHDVIKQIFPRLSEKNELRIARISTCIAAIIAILLASIGKDVLELLWFTDNFWLPLTMVPLIAGFLKFRTNSKSFIVASATAILSTVISGYIVGEVATISLMCGITGSAVGLFGMHYWQVHQGTLSVNTQPTQFTDTAIKKNTDIGSKIALTESQGRHMFEDVEERTKTIADELKTQSFIQGVEQGLEKGRLEGIEEVASNLLLQGLDISIIESATGLSKENLVRCRKALKQPIK